MGIIGPCTNDAMNRLAALMPPEMYGHVFRTGDGYMAWLRPYSDGPITYGYGYVPEEALHEALELQLGAAVLALRTKEPSRG